jgi:hypothetical protein
VRPWYVQGDAATHVPKDSLALFRTASDVPGEWMEQGMMLGIIMGSGISVPLQLHRLLCLNWFRFCIQMYWFRPASLQCLDSACGLLLK